MNLRRVLLALLIGLTFCQPATAVGQTGPCTTYDSLSKTTIFCPPVACDKIVSVVSAAGASLTATIPAEAGRFHYFCEIRVVEYAAANLGGAATPITITTTNLPGNFQMTMATGLAVGTFDIRTFTFPLRSSVANTDTTVTSPATPNVIWRINIFYATAP